MKLDTIRVDGMPGGESLTAAIVALLDAHLCSFESDDVNSVLGTSYLSVAADAPLSLWSKAGRDIRLIDSARVFGVHLRPLHPTAAARGLENANEFADHFRDSYVPLIRRALAAGEPVLAWQGWPGHAALDWGIITRVSGSQLGVAGTAPGFDEVVELKTPAIQCYVVESVTGASPSAIDLLVHSLNIAATLMTGKQRFAGPWITGPTTHDNWRQRLINPTDGDCADDHAAIAHAIASNRKCAGRFLSRHQSVIISAGRAVELIIRHSRLAGELATELVTMFRSGELDDALRGKCAERVRQIQSEDEAIADNVSTIVQRLTALAH